MQFFSSWQTDFYLSPYFRQGGAALIPILISAEVSYFLLLLCHWKTFHMYLQSIADSENIRKTCSPARSLHVRACPRTEPVLGFQSTLVAGPALLVVILHKSALQKNINK